MLNPEALSRKDATTTSRFGKMSICFTVSGLAISRRDDLHIGDPPDSVTIK